MTVKYEAMLTAGFGSTVAVVSVKAHAHQTRKEPGKPGTNEKLIAKPKRGVERLPKQNGGLRCRLEFSGISR